MAKHLVNKAAAGVPYYTPAQDPPAGTALDPTSAPTLFQPLQIRGLTLQNRFVVGPMCQYSADDGHLTDWHFAHLSKYMIHGTALTFVEASAVLPNGRITPEDAGIWKDSHIEPMRRIVNFAHSQNQKIAIQLAHAGRKASTVAPWLRPGGNGSDVAADENGGWARNVWGPSAIPFSKDGYATPNAMTLDDIKALTEAFRDSARRAVAAGFDVIEIHAAHGYLLTEFLSPLSNQRTDAYGGSFENRTRLLLEVLAVVREVIPADMPLFVRISATEWMEYTGQPSWDLESSIQLARLLPAAGVDLLDVSSGGNAEAQKIEIHPYFQVNLAAKIREALKADGLKLLIGAVGFITDGEMARSIVQEGSQKTVATGAAATPHDTIVESANGSTDQPSRADVVFVARQFLREPEFTLRTAQKLGVDVKWPNQYHRGGWARGQKL